MTDSAEYIIDDAFDEYTATHDQPRAVVVPQKLFDEFAADAKSKGHSLSVWGVPITGADVKEICFAHEPRNLRSWRCRNTWLLPFAIGALAGTALFTIGSRSDGLLAITDFIAFGCFIFALFIGAIIVWRRVRR